MHTRRAFKFLHTLASCGLIGALFAYAIVLVHAPQDTPGAYADMRQTISALCTYLLLPSLGLALFTGLISMAIHRPYQNKGWAWIKALLGISMFEATLAVIQSKANYAAKLSRQIEANSGNTDALVQALSYEWHSLGIILLLSIANIVLGVWRPRIMRRVQTKPQAE